VISGERIRLRRAEPQRDLDDRWRWMNDPEVLRYLGTVGAPLSREEVKEYLEKAAKSTESLLDLAIETNDGRFIGAVTLRNLERWTRQAELAILIGESGMRGKGYGTEATRLAVELAFGRLNLNRLWLTVNVRNEAGIRAYRKGGFQVEGTLRQNTYAWGEYHDSHIMGILRQDWEASRS
jgi:RimJ/RimL family protein N-acetyltransferase